MSVWAVDHKLAHEVNVGRGDLLRIGEDFGHLNRNGDLIERDTVAIIIIIGEGAEREERLDSFSGSLDLIDPEVRIRRDDGPAGEIHSLSGQVPAKPAGLALQPLHKTPRGFLGLWVR